ncbi:MAG TPA: DUF2085 domain-containing protein [Pyrinomonadaceae bacterium]|nr:DUF2085 domain-containing protein [Pyrinomonadaceae bacterium]
MPASISEYVPQFGNDVESARRARVAWAAWGAAVAGAAGFVGLIVLAPLLQAKGALAAAQAIYHGFSVACHQESARAFHIEGFPLAVCARCTGLYAGALAGIAAYPFARNLASREMPWRMWLILAAVPTTVDFALGFFGVWDNTHLSRFLTASLLGVVSAFYIVPGLVDLSLTSRRGRLFGHGLPRES